MKDKLQQEIALGKQYVGTDKLGILVCGPLVKIRPADKSNPATKDEVDILALMPAGPPDTAGDKQTYAAGWYHCDPGSIAPVVAP